MKRAVLITLMAVILMVLDMYLTYYYISNYRDIVGEGNPIFISEYGYLWIPINLGYLMAVFFAALIYGRYKTVQLDAKNTLDYIKKLYHSQHVRFIFVNGCFTFIVSSFISRATAITDWLVFGMYAETFFESGYAVFRAMMPFSRYDAVTSIIAAVIAIPLWFHLEYLKSKKITQMGIIQVDG